MTQFRTTTHGMAIRAMESDDVKVALAAYLADKNNYTEHRLNSALSEVGYTNLKDRERIITFLERSPKFGGGQDD